MRLGALRLLQRLLHHPPLPARDMTWFVYAGANAMAISLARGKRTTLAKVDAFADGVAVKTVCLLRQCAHQCPPVPTSSTTCTLSLDMKSGT